MSVISVLRRILNNTPGSATDIDYNFQALESYVNTAVVTTDGLNAVTGAPLVVPTPIADNHAATKGYVDSILFTGMMIDFAGATLPVSMVDEWELCQGQTRSTADPKYVALFTVIGYAYGGSGGTFALPDCRGRTTVGLQATEAAFSPLGKTGGQRNSELYQHQHQIPQHGHAASTANDTGDHTHNMGTGATGDGNADHTHISNGGHTEVMFYDSTGYFSGYAIPSTSGAGAGGASVQWGPLNSTGHLHQHLLLGNTGGVLARHTHPVTVTDRLAFNTDPSGVGTTITDKNLPPYVVANKAIKL